jgi:hypothetical protein
MVIAAAVMCTLLHLAFGVLEHQEPCDANHQPASPFPLPGTTEPRAGETLLL